MTINEPAWKRLSAACLVLSLALRLTAAITLPTPAERETPPVVPPSRDAPSAARTATNTAAAVDRPLRLTLELQDGSRIIGVPTQTNLPIRSLVGNMAIDLNRVVAIQFSADKETAVVSFQNGDKVTGTLGAPEYQLQTTFGAVRIPPAVIRRIGVLPAGKSQRGLVLHYPFDQDDGEVVKDRSGLGHDGRLKGPKWTLNGQRGGGCQFSQNLDEMSAGNPEALRLQDFTVALWIKRARPDTPSTGPWGCALLSYHSHGYGLGLRQDGLPYIGDHTGQQFAAVQRVTDTDFHHLAVAKDGNKVAFYLDGEPCGEATMEAKYDDFQELFIGTVGNGRGYPFNGIMDDIMLFNRPLTAEEIKQVYRETQGGVAR